MNMTPMKVYGFPVLTGMVVSVCWIWLFGFWAGNVDTRLFSFLFNTLGIRSLVLVSNLLFSAFAAILFAFPVFVACETSPLKGIFTFVGSFATSFLVVQYVNDPDAGVLSNIAFIFSLSPFSPILMFLMLLGLCVFLLSRLSRIRKVHA